MKIILTGATGTAGSEVLHQALLNPLIEKICVLSRRPLSVSHPKLEVLLHSDFTVYSSVFENLKDCDAWLWCLGISQNDVDEAEYLRITYDYALAAASALSALNPNSTFCFLSGAGADSREKSRILFARVKGKTENALNSIPKIRVFHFRPGYIHPVNSRPKRWFERALEPLTPWMYRFLPSQIISTIELAQAMLRVAEKGCPQKILDNNEIRRQARAASG